MNAAVSLEGLLGQAIDSITSYVDSIQMTNGNLTDANAICESLQARIREVQLKVSMKGQKEDATRYNQMITSITEKLDRSHPLIAKTIRQCQYLLNIDHFSLPTWESSLNFVFPQDHSRPQSLANLASVATIHQTNTLKEMCSHFLTSMESFLSLLEQELQYDITPFNQEQHDWITKLTSNLASTLTEYEDETSANLLGQLLDLNDSSTLQDFKGRCEKLNTIITFYLLSLPTPNVNNNFVNLQRDLPTSAQSSPPAKVPSFQFDREATKKCFADIEKPISQLRKIASGSTYFSQRERQTICQELHVLLEPYFQLLECYKQNPLISRKLADVYFDAMSFLSACFEEAKKNKILSSNLSTNSKKRSYAVALLGGDFDAELLEIKNLRTAFKRPFQQVCEEVLVTLRPQLQMNPRSQELILRYVSAWGLLLDYSSRIYTLHFARRDCRALGIDFETADEELITMRENFKP